MAMFDDNPQSSATGVVPATAISYTNTGERKNIHYIESIFDPDQHTVADLQLGKYVVPQEGEMVIDMTNFQFYVVEKVDWQATLKSTLKAWFPVTSGDEPTAEQDWIFGLRGGPMIGEALLSVDYSVRPNVARVDATVMRPGASYAHVLIGDDYSDKTKIISATYDNSGNMLNNEVPVQLAEIVDRTNINIMTTSPFSVTKNAEALTDGMRCWLLFFDEGDVFIPPAQPLMVQQSSYLKDHRLGVKYITAIELIAPWFTNTGNPERLIIPLNLPLLTVELRAVVHYSDGSKSAQLPVNGGQFSLYGLEEYRPSWPGQTGRITLTYQLAAGEDFYVADAANPDKKSRTYTLEASAVNGAYSPRIYTYPQWDPTIVGYRLQHFLFDLDRQAYVDVTDKVTLNDKSPAYKPSSYGLTQDLIFNLNLRDVSPTYASVTFIQYTEIVLLKDINGTGTRWSVNFQQGTPDYAALFIKTVNNGTLTTFNVANGLADAFNVGTSFTPEQQETWLNELYWAIQPSYNRFNEDKAPTPTHFDLMHEDGRRWRYSIDNFITDNSVSISLPIGKTMYLNWVNRSADGTELQLGTTGLVVTA